MITKHVVVTGGCGYKGHVLVKRLLEAQHCVTVLDSMWFGNYLLDELHLKVQRVDLRDDYELPQADTVIHLAAVANDPSALLDPKLTWESNALATQRLLDKCVQKEVCQFIYASSGSVYGVKPDDVEVTEDLELTPLSEYNKTKMVAERVALSYKDKMDVTILRPATVCGVSPRMRLDVAVNALTYSALHDGKIILNGGSQVRPNVHMEDICRAYMWVLHNPVKTSGQTYNVGFENFNLSELARIIASRVGTFQNKMVQIETRDLLDPRSYRLNSKKILEAGFTPTHQVVNAVDEIIEAYKNKGWNNSLESCYNMKWMEQCQIR